MATLTPEQQKFSDRFPWTKPFLAEQADHWEKLVEEVHKNYPEHQRDEAVGVLTIRGFESERKCLNMIATQRSYVRGFMVGR